MLVSAESGDDAAVYRLPDGTGLVATVDIVTPIVDDAFDWGRIAAANALSDVYAMGGTPRLALAFAGWPVDDLPVETLAEVLRGGREVVTSAGAAILGGHTITATEPLYGLVALGYVDPGRIVRNDGAVPGMTLFLTKPIGTGIIATAIKRGVATAEQIDDAISTMVALNADAAEAMVRAGVATATDVTGFGLLGHLRRVLEASGCAAEVDAGGVPVLPGVLELAQRDVVPAGTKRNLAWVNDSTGWGDLTPSERLVLADAQTSGGLLLVTSEPRALEAEMSSAGLPAARIGRTVAGPAGHVTVLGSIGEPKE